MASSPTRPMGGDLDGLTAGEGRNDPTGVRRLLRHHLSKPLSLIFAVLLVMGAILGLGQPQVLALLGALVLCELAIEFTRERMGRPIGSDTALQIILFGWPLGLAALGAASWSVATDDYHGELATLIGMMAGGYVGLVAPRWTAIGWGLLAGIALTLGAVTVAPLTWEVVVTTASTLTGLAFGMSIGEILERHLDRRRQMLQTLNRMAPSSDPYGIAATYVDSLLRWTPLRNASMTWFTDDGRSIVLAIRGDNLPPVLGTGRALPEHRNAYLREQSDNGPWITGWSVRDDDEGYSAAVAKAGISTAAYVPMVHEGHVLGILGVGQSEAAGGRAAITEHFPLLVELAEHASQSLGPALARDEARTTASEMLDRVLSQRLYWPVFQPIRNLDTQQVVGFEGLSRFDAPVSAARLFAQAVMLNRLRDLEIATLRVTVEQSMSLPVDSFLSVNSSPELLVEPDILAAILAPTTRPIVIELSEREQVADYGPITAALEMLGPGRTLAVDDAGAGFASLRHILEARPTYVKLDLGLVQGVATDPSRRALVTAMVHFASEAGFTLIAEGVETDPDLGTLRDLGVHLGQGYLLGKPARVPARGFKTSRVPSSRKARTAPGVATPLT